MEKIQGLVGKQFEIILINTNAVMVSRHNTSICKINPSKNTDLVHVYLADDTVISLNPGELKVEETETTLILSFLKKEGCHD